MCPSGRLTNDDLSQMVETSDEWIVTRTGIRERRVVAPDEGTSHLATRAAQEALEDAGIAPDELDLIIVATTTPDLTFPPTACLVQGNLGAKRANAFDMNAVCSGFLNALVVGSVKAGTKCPKTVGAKFPKNAGLKNPQPQLSSCIGAGGGK